MGNYGGGALAKLDGQFHAVLVLERLGDGVLQAQPEITIKYIIIIHLKISIKKIFYLRAEASLPLEAVSTWDLAESVAERRVFKAVCKLLTSVSR